MAKNVKLDARVTDRATPNIQRIVEHRAHKSINRRSVRRWLSKALGSSFPEYLLLEHDNSPSAPEIPEWALALHAAGQWRVMAYREVRFIHADPTMQAALMAAHRLGGGDAMLALLDQELRKAGLR